jgi:hypothetical protein
MESKRFVCVGDGVGVSSRVRLGVGLRLKLIVVVGLFLTQHVFCQQGTIENKVQIESVLQTFMECIETKDSVKMYSLFHDAPVAWVGVYKGASQEKILEKDSTKVDTCPIKIPSRACSWLVTLEASLPRMTKMTICFTQR